ncbi:MAG: hypothetical protein LBS71_01595 [Puniceicoccales bacterium]|jgi:predicted alpha/beta superfamily hydrolase|nr:hypothetical protein [Puniceicoccales bacterium]
MRKIFCILLCLLTGCQHRNGISEKKKREVTIPNTEEFILRSQVNRVPYKLFVALPDDYKQSSEKYPVLYLTDADFMFPIARATCTPPFLDKSGHWQKIIIVGVSYQNQDFSHTNEKAYHFHFKKNRNRMRNCMGGAIVKRRDYMGAAIAKSMEKFLDKDVTAEMLKDIGQAEKIKDFLGKELIPYVDQHYRTNGENALGGSSSGGHFALWVLLNNPELFQKYIGASPAPWTEGGYLLKQLSNLTYTHPIKLYLSIGDKEKEIKGKCDNFTDKNAMMQYLYAEIGKHGNIQTKFEVLKDQDHYRACACGLIKGMEYIFKNN